MAIFKSVPQALHFAYTIQAYEIGAESAMTKALRRIMMDLGIWEEPGTASSSVDFEGLDRIEVRAQCAMIRAMVHDHLPELERWAIEARYELVVPETEAPRWRQGVPAAERGRAVSRRTTGGRFSPAKQAAIEGLAHYLAPAFTALSAEQLKLMVVRAAVPHAVQGGCRVLADGVGMNYRTFARAARGVRDRVVVLENQAMDRLHPLMAGGLVE